MRRDSDATMCDMCIYIYIYKLELRMSFRNATNV